METNIEENKTQIKQPPLIVLLLVSSFSIVIALIISPSLPDFARYFGLSEFKVKEIISWFMIGTPFGVIFFAPLSNRIGRKKTLYLGLCITLFGVLVSTSTYFYKNFFLMNLGRIIQGFGSIVGFQIAMTLVGDCFKPPQTRVISACLIIAFSFGWGVSVALGSFLGSLSWLYSFYFMILYAITLLVLTKFFIHETLLTKKNESFSYIIKNYVAILKTPEVLASGILRGSVGSITYIFPAVSPFIVIDLLGYSKSVFGMWNFIPPFGLISGCFLSMFFAKRTSIMSLFLTGLIIVSLVVLGYFFIFEQKLLSLFSVFIPYLLCLFGLGFVNTNTIAYALRYSEDKASCSSVFNFFAYGCAGIYLLLLPFVKIRSAYILPIVFTSLFIIGWIVFALIWILRKVRDAK